LKAIFIFISTWILSIIGGTLGIKLLDDCYYGKVKIIAVAVLILVVCIVACNLLALILQVI
jgi:hypothetical protein